FRVCLGDLSEPLHPQVRDLDRNAGRPAWHMDGRAPAVAEIFSDLVALGACVRSVGDSVATWRSVTSSQPLLWTVLVDPAFTIEFQPRLAHPQPIADAAEGAAHAGATEGVAIILAAEVPESVMETPPRAVGAIRRG